MRLIVFAFALSATAFAQAKLPALPAPMAVPKPAPATDAPYAPQPYCCRRGGCAALCIGFAVSKNGARPRTGRIQHEPVGARPHREHREYSQPLDPEVHVVDGSLNTGAAIILAAGGGHKTLNVGTESADFVPFFYNYGVNTIILRNRLRRDGYNPQTDAVYDALQAVRMVRAYAKEWKIDTNKIGIMGFFRRSRACRAGCCFIRGF